MMPWWLAAIVFFFVGMAVERFIIDRRFIREWQTRWTELHDEIRRIERDRDS